MKKLVIDPAAVVFELRFAPGDCRHLGIDEGRAQRARYQIVAAQGAAEMGVGVGVGGTGVHGGFLRDF